MLGVPPAAATAQPGRDVRLGKRNGRRTETAADMCRTRRAMDRRTAHASAYNAYNAYNAY